MLYSRTFGTLLLLSSAAAFSINSKPSAGKKGILSDVKKNLSNGLVVGFIATAATFMPISQPANAAADLVLGTPLEAKLVKFGSASYPVFNSITDVSPLADRFVDFIDKKVKAPDAAAVAQTAVDGLLAIPDSKISEYSGVLRQVVYSGVNPNSCVTLGGSGSFFDKLKASSAVKSVDSSKMDALQKKFKPANSNVPMKDGNICLPGSAAASEKLWVAQADLTLSMPKKEADALVSNIKKAGLQATRPTIGSLVPAAESVFSRSPEALQMVQAGKEVEPLVISTVKAALN